jgi:hypothetical protein
MIRIAQRNAADSTLPGERDGPLHDAVSIQVARTASAIPSFQIPDTPNPLGTGVNIDATVINHFNVLWKSV